MSNFENLGNGIIYTKDYITLYSVTSKETIDIDYRCTTIRGESSYSYAFKDSASTLKSFTIPQNSQLQTIQAYAFYQCTKLQSVDLSNCSNLTLIGGCAFQSCTSITSFILPNSILYIKESALNSLYKLQNITLPSSLKEIGSGILSYSGITSIVFEKGIQIPGFTSGCFSNTKLKTIKIPASIITFYSSSISNTEIEYITVEEGNKNFIVKNDILLSIDLKTLYYYPIKLTNCTIPEGVETISAYSFSYSMIQTIKLPSSLKTIEYSAFSSCKQLESILIPKNVTYIGYNAFYNNIKLSSITFEEPSSLLTIESRAFSACSSLQRINIPNSVTSIASDCFNSCYNLKYIKMSDGIKTLGGGIFNGCNDDIEIEFGNESPFSYIKDQNIIISKDNKTIYQFLSSIKKEVVIPSQIETIKKSTFANRINITTMIFESDNTLTTIEGNAFEGCTNLATLNLPMSIITISDFAFSRCINIKSINLQQCSYLGSYAFNSCSKLESVTFRVLKSVPNNCFYKCVSLSSINLGEVYTSIGDYAFDGTNITEISFPASLNSIGSYAFSSSEITTITFQQPTIESMTTQQGELKMTEIGDLAFCGATLLKTINNLPESVKIFGKGCFSQTGFECFIVPPQITSINESCFENCVSLISFNITENSQLSHIGINVFRGCKNLEFIEANNRYFFSENNALFNIERTDLIIFPPASKIRFFYIPEKVETISQGAFYGCSNLIHILIPENKSLTTIGMNAFDGCTSLTIINIPNTVTNIQQDAFNGCNSLKCGLIIELNENIDRNNLISNAKFPKRALNPCIEKTCPQKANKRIPAYILFITCLNRK